MVAASFTSRIARNLPPKKSLSPSDWVSEARQDVEAVLSFLEALENEFKKNPLGIPSGYLFAGPGTFHRTPADFKDRFVAGLLVVWSQFRGEAISALKIGSPEYQRGVLGFLAAAVMPLNGEEGEDLIPLSTMRTHALALRKIAKKYGDNIVVRLSQIVVK